MRVALLCDIHANLPALDAVLEEVREVGVDEVIVGGDILPGPMSGQTLARLLDLEIPVQIVHGNAELAVLAQLAASDPEDVEYWGTTSGGRLPPPLQEVLRWTAGQVAAYEDLIASWPKSLTLDVAGLGPVLFCHAAPRDETAIITRLTPEERVLPMFEGVDASTVACGHTHMQFDRMVAEIRVVNAGSVGMPFGPPGADWQLLGPDVEFRHTDYDLEAAAALVRGTAYPQADDFAANNILAPPTQRKTLEAWGERVEPT